MLSTNYNISVPCNDFKVPKPLRSSMRPSAAVALVQPPQPPVHGRGGRPNLH